MLRDILTKAPILKSPSKNFIFILDTDSSNLDIGEKYVIPYASNRLSNTEQKYCATRKELFTI